MLYHREISNMPRNESNKRRAYVWYGAYRCLTCFFSHDRICRAILQHHSSQNDEPSWWFAWNSFDKNLSVFCSNCLWQPDILQINPNSDSMLAVIALIIYLSNNYQKNIDKIIRQSTIGSKNLIINILTRILSKIKRSLRINAYQFYTCRQHSSSLLFALPCNLLLLIYLPFVTIFLQIQQYSCNYLTESI